MFMSCIKYFVGYTKKVYSIAMFLSAMDNNVGYTIPIYSTAMFRSAMNDKMRGISSMKTAEISMNV